MRIEYKNEGKYASYLLDGNSLIFCDGELSLDLAMLQEDYPVKLTVSKNSEGKLKTGVSERYVAEIYIPERKSIVERTGAVNPFGFPMLRYSFAPFDMDEVVLTLWAVR